jgi:DNA-binding transcriptional regulator YiaG
MKWKYYIPHVWDDERYSWEDFWLRPCDPDFSGKNIILTIETLGDGSWRDWLRREDYEDRLRQIQDKEYDISGDDMIVRGVAFSKEEFLKWVKIWLSDNDFDVDELVEAPFEDFKTTLRSPTVTGECNLIPEELESREKSQQSVAGQEVDAEMKNLQELEKHLNCSYLVEKELEKMYCDHLRAIREAAGVSQEEFAEFLGLSIESLRMMEEGTYKGSKLDLLDALKEALKVYEPDPVA